MDVFGSCGYGAVSQDEFVGEDVVAYETFLGCEEGVSASEG